MLDGGPGVAFSVLVNIAIVHFVVAFVTVIHVGKFPSGLANLGSLTREEGI